MKARLGGATCGRYYQPMTEKTHRDTIVVEGDIQQSNDVLTFNGFCARYAYHFDCWNSINKNKRKQKMTYFGGEHG